LWTPLFSLNNVNDKNMKSFVSKSPNYQLILRPGIPGSRALGTPPIKGLSVRFEDGKATIQERDTETLRLMYEHPSFNREFFDVSSGNVPSIRRVESEPKHILTEMKYGQMENTVNAPIKGEEHKMEVMNAAVQLLKELFKNSPKELSDIINSIGSNTVNSTHVEKIVEKPITQEKKHPSITAPTPIEDTSGAFYDKEDIQPAVEKEVLLEVNPNKIGGVSAPVDSNVPVFGTESIEDTTSEIKKKGRPRKEDSNILQ
jgi:hypothetical protein